MSRRDRLRAAGRAVSGLTAGNVAVGLSGFVFLAAGPRLLGADAYSSLAVAWTIVTIFGVGLAQPAEQTTTRLVAGGGAATSTGVTRRLALIAVAFVAVPLVTVTGLIPWFSALPWLGWVTWLAVLAWVPLARTRGRAAGAADFRGYTASLLVESAVRVVMVLLALVVPGAGPALLGAALVVPLLAAALTRRSTRPGQGSGPADDGDPAATGGMGDPGPATTSLREQGVITLSVLALQLVVNSPPLWLSARLTDQALAGAFVTVSAYLRIPIFVSAAFATFALTHVSAAHGRGDHAGARRLMVRSVVPAALVGLAATAVVVVAAPVALPLLYGSPPDIPPAVLAALAVSTVLLIPLGVWSLALFGLLQARGVAVSMLAAAATTTVLCAATTTTLGPVAVAVVAGPAVGLIGLAIVTVVSARRAGPGRPAP